MLAVSAGCAFAQDWPQWRGANRDAKASGFTAPKTWPKELTQKWKVTVGLGDASPAVVGNKLYVFARQGTDEVIRCLDAANGKELWQEKYDATQVSGPSASAHSGPRSSPAVADGKVVTLGVGGVVSCVDAATGKLVWRKDDFSGAWPRFYTSSSPIVTDGLCIAHWAANPTAASSPTTWPPATRNGSGPATARPTPPRSLLTAGGTKMVVTLTAKKIVGSAWRMASCSGKSRSRSRAWPTMPPRPIVDGQTVIYAGAGRGTKAVKIEKTADGFAAKELWSNPDNAVQFNSPVLKGGQIYGVSQNGVLFCLDAQSGKTLWTSELGGRGFGSIVDAGSVLLALTPKATHGLRTQRQGIQEAHRLQSRRHGNLRLPRRRGQRPVREGKRRRLVLGHRVSFHRL